ncbi:MAG: 50S ribosomal protein L16 [Spirochaetia bacterium]
MLSPKRVKHRKTFRPRFKKKATRGNTIAFGDYGLIAVEPKWVTARQIEAARVAMTRKIKRGGKVWIRLFPDTPYTKKPAETRMGKGKGAPEAWITPVNIGTVMFEIAGVDQKLAEAAMRLASHKLPLKTKFVARRNVE